MAGSSSLSSLLRDVVTSLAVVAIVLGGLWAYAGMWPPMVVVESGSMQHSETTSYVGVIDTGDLTLVRSMGRVDHITTWAEGKRTGYSTYGNFGDVIVFHKNGYTQYTPIIHRAMVYIELNATTSDSFDVPDLGLYDTLHITLQGLRTYHTGTEQVIDLPVNLGVILDNFKGFKAPHGGYITKGDNNPNVDQISLFWDTAPAGSPPRAEPVERAWIMGVSRGELPWFGILKLWFGKQSQAVADDSWYDLLLTVGLLITVPVLIDLSVAAFRERREGEGEKEEGGPRPWPWSRRRAPSGVGAAPADPPPTPMTSPQAASPPPQPYPSLPQPYPPPPPYGQQAAPLQQYQSPQYPPQPYPPPAHPTQPEAPPPYPPQPPRPPPYTPQPYPLQPLARQPYAPEQSSPRSHPSQPQPYPQQQYPQQPAPRQPILQQPFPQQPASQQPASQQPIPQQAPIPPGMPSPTPAPSVPPAPRPQYPSPPPPSAQATAAPPQADPPPQGPDARRPRAP